MVPICSKFSGRVLVSVALLIATISPMTVSASEDMREITEDLNSKDWKVRLAGVEKLGASRDERSLPMLIEVANFGGEHTEVRVRAIQLLGETGDPKALESLLDIFNDSMLSWECPAIKSYTATALGNFRDDKRLDEALIGGINDRELLTREASIRSLGKIRSSKSVPYLLNVLDDERVSIKLSAIKALEEIGNPQAIPYLERIAEKDSDTVVRNQARAALSVFRHHSQQN
ncbi:MAG TPA: HEAT repeat domain-containing protein [Thermodesulfovibrionales bacterium]|nr:HEAT repeat domain-containing protein [Thermodesulfovibrionales bacterium]